MREGERDTTKKIPWDFRFCQLIDGSSTSQRGWPNPVMPFCDAYWLDPIWYGIWLASMLDSGLYSGWAVSTILVVSRRVVPNPVIPFWDANLFVPEAWAIVICISDHINDKRQTGLERNLRLIRLFMVVLRVLAVLHLCGLTTSSSESGHALRQKTNVNITQKLQNKLMITFWESYLLVP